MLSEKNTEVLEQGDETKVLSKIDHARFIMISSKLLKEHVPRLGSFVMNTQE